MNVLTVGRFHKEGFALHVAETLRRMGHTAFEYEVGATINVNPGMLQRRWQKLKTFAREASRQVPWISSFDSMRLKHYLEGRRINLTIVCHDFLTPTEVKAVQDQTKSPVVMWFPDHCGQFQRSYFLTAGYDGVFFKDPYIVHELSQKLDLPLYYLPECCNPDVHRVCELDEHDMMTYGCDITTAGNLHSYRVAFFRRLGDYRIKIWGLPPPSWLHPKDLNFLRGIYQERYVANEEKSKAFRGAKIVVNNLHPAEIWGVNVRAFEIAAAGGFQLIDWKPGLSQLFTIDRELVAFTCMADLIDKIDYYLEHDRERKDIAESGMRRAHADHTYENRLRLLMDTVFGKEKGFPLPELSMINYQC